ncbi:MAG: hypothetical protein Q8936_10930 [Bacillota bacterium]|nr:hypothetical protein [Bacillota bacterium]
MVDNKYLIANKKERIRVRVSLIVFVLIAAYTVYLITQNNVSNFRSLRHLGGLAGQIAAFGFAFAIGMYVLRRIAKRISSKEIKQKILFVAKILREWHVPIAVVAFSVILLHAYIMLSRGLVFNIRYISGIVALVILAVQAISGIFRYKRIGIKFHMVTGILFTVSMIIHLLS